MLNVIRTGLLVTVAVLLHACGAVSTKFQAAIFDWNPFQGLYEKYQCTVTSSTAPLLCHDLLKYCVHQWKGDGYRLNWNMSWIAHNDYYDHILSIDSDCSDIFRGHNIRIGHYDKSMADSKVMFPTLSANSLSKTFTVHNCSNPPHFLPFECQDVLLACPEYHYNEEWLNMMPYRVNPDRTVTALSWSDNCADLFLGIPIHFASNVTLGNKTDVTIHAVGKNRLSLQIYYTATSSPRNIFRDAFPDGGYEPELCAYALWAGSNHSDPYNSNSVYDTIKHPVQSLKIVEKNDTTIC